MGEELFQSLTACIQEAIAPAGAAATTDSFQTLTLRCMLEVLLLTPEGELYANTEERLEALAIATGMALPSGLHQGQAKAVQLQRRNEALLSVPVTIGTETVPFLLDTGASNSLVSQELLASAQVSGFRIPPELLHYFVVGEDCSDISLSMHTLPPLRVAEASVQGLTGLGMAAAAIPTQAGGVLGMDFLGGFELELDPRSHTLSLNPLSTSDQPPVSAATIPLQGKLGVMVADVEVNRQGPFPFLLDTGAELTVISDELAETLQLPYTQGQTTLVQGFCGAESARIVTLNQVTLQDHSNYSVRTVVLGSDVLEILGVQGIIGQNILNQYRQVWRFGPTNLLGFPEAGSLRLYPY
jgi:predicted aspartyl protease